MEFLDSKSKKKRAVKLFTGYFLMVIVVGLATLILVYLAQGYGYDPSKGVMQNGLVFVDSKPASADIYLNDEYKGNTNARLVLKEGQYTLNLKRDEYRSWNKSFSLNGGTVLYFLYPKLFPVDIPVTTTKVFTNVPVWASQSPDRHWLVLQQQANSPVLTVIDLSNPAEDTFLRTIPQEQLAGLPTQMGTITPIEWSNDNEHLLLLQQLPDGTKSFIVFDINNPNRTVNVSTKLGVTSTVSIKLKDKKYDQFYLLDSATTELKKADLRSGVTPRPVLTNVIAYKSYGDNRVVYATYENAETDKARVLILEGQKNQYLLQDVARDPNNKYLLDIAEYNNNWYYVVASSVGKNIKIYRNPLSRSNPGNTEPISSQMSLKLDNPQFVSFSDNTRFIAMQSAKNFVVFDGEQNRVFRYTSPLEIADGQQAKWMDGHRLSVVTNNKIRVFEFDGQNLQALIDSRAEFNAYFDRDHKYIYALMPQADGKTALENGKLTL